MLAEMKKSIVEYAPEQDVPLTGYATTMLVYAGALSLVSSRVARKARWQPGLVEVALLGVATHKLSRIITKDFVTAPLRAPFTRRQEKEGAGEVHDEPQGRNALAGSIGYLLTCPYCMGPWLSMSLSAMLAFFPAQTRFVLRMLTAVTISDFLHLGYSRLNESRKTVLATRQLTERTAGAVRAGELAPDRADRPDASPVNLRS
jgi:uncharacterized protein DUF1360